MVRLVGVFVGSSDKWIPFGEISINSHDGDFIIFANAPACEPAESGCSGLKQRGLQMTTRLPISCGVVPLMARSDASWRGHGRLTSGADEKSPAPSTQIEVYRLPS